MSLDNIVSQGEMIPGALLFSGKTIRVCQLVPLLRLVSS